MGDLTVLSDLRYGRQILDLSCPCMADPNSVSVHAWVCPKMGTTKFNGSSIMFPIQVASLGFLRCLSKPFVLPFYPSGDYTSLQWQYIRVVTSPAPVAFPAGVILIGLVCFRCRAIIISATSIQYHLKMHVVILQSLANEWRTRGYNPLL